MGREEGHTGRGGGQGGGAHREVYLSFLLFSLRRN